MRVFIDKTCSFVIVYAQTTTNRKNHFTFLFFCTRLYTKRARFSNPYPLWIPLIFLPVIVFFVFKLWKKLKICRLPCTDTTCRALRGSDEVIPKDYGEIRRRPVTSVHRYVYKNIKKKPTFSFFVHRDAAHRTRNVRHGNSDAPPPTTVSWSRAMSVPKCTHTFVSDDTNELFSNLFPGFFFSNTVDRNLRRPRFSSSTFIPGKKKNYLYKLISNRLNRLFCSGNPTLPYRY